MDQPKTRIDWVAIPNGISDAGGARVSVAVMPTFQDGAESVDGFPFLHWTSFVKDAGGQFSLSVNSNSPITIKAKIEGVLVPDLWEAAFGLPTKKELAQATDKQQAQLLANARNTMVCRSERSIQEKANVPVQTYSSLEWLRKLRGVYGDAIKQLSSVGSSTLTLSASDDLKQINWYEFGEADAQKNAALLLRNDPYQDAYNRLLARFCRTTGCLTMELITALNTIHGESKPNGKYQKNSTNFNLIVARVFALHSRVPKLGQAHTDAQLGVKAPLPPTCAQRVQTIRQFTSLLRPLGLVLDLEEFPVSQLPADDCLISIIPKWNIPQADVHSPTTIVTKPHTHFRTKETGREDDFALSPLINDGVLSPSRLLANSLDLAGAAFKIASFASSRGKAALRADTPKAAPRFMANERVADRPPSLKSTGMTIYMKDRGAQARSDALRASEIADATDADVKYVADDLRFGCVVFARIKERHTDASAGEWMSLVARDEEFQFGNGTKWTPPQGTQEAPVRFLPTKPLDKTTAQAAPPEVRELPEDILTIEQQHLTSSDSSQPTLSASQYQLDNQKTSQPLKYLDVRLISRPAGKILAKRFGNIYEFCFPIVDLAGNVPWTLSQVSKDSTIPTIEQKLLRYEPLSPPLLLAEPGYTLKDGESLDNITLRDGDGQNVRWLIPPKVDFYFAQWHGVFDWLLPGEGNEPEGFDGISFQDNGDFIRTGQHIPVYMQPGRPGSSYYPDPMARRIYAEISDLPNSTVLRVESPISLYKDEGWWPTNLVPVEIRAIPTNRDASISTSGSRITVFVPPAHILALNVRCTFAPLPENAGDRKSHDIMAHGLCQWVGDDSLADIADGLNDVVCPAHPIVVTHAVRKPLQFELKSCTVSRGAGESNTRFGADMLIDRKSTGKIRVDATWRDPKVDFTKADGIDYQPGKVHIGEVVAPSPTTDDSTAFTFPTTIFDAGNTKHRVLTVTATGETAFRSFYPTASNETAERDYTVQSVCQQVELLHSNSAPEILTPLYAVPAFDHSSGVKTDGSVVRLTKASILRVYFDDSDTSKPQTGRFSTGDGELYGVVVSPTPDKPLSCGAPTAELSQILPFVTRWGPDPIVAANSYSLPLPRIDDFEHEAGASVNPSVFLPGTRLKVGVVGHLAHPHEPFPGRKLWYSDIVLKQVPTYGTFIRLSLVRFQPQSLDGCHISQPFALDFAQLGNDRAITIKRTDTRVLSITISGVANPKSGKALGNTIQVLVLKQAHGVPERLVTDKDAVVSPNEPQEEPSNSETLWTGTVEFKDRFTSTAGPRKIAVREVRRIAQTIGDKAQESIVFADLFTAEDSW